MEAPLQEVTGLDVAAGVAAVRRELDQLDEQIRCELLLASDLHRELAACTGRCAELRQSLEAVGAQRQEREAEADDLRCLLECQARAMKEAREELKCSQVGGLGCVETLAGKGVVKDLLAGPGLMKSRSWADIDAGGGGGQVAGYCYCRVT